MNIDHISQSLAFKYISAVAECGSIRRAGELLNVSAPSINRKIIEYEAALGTKLFERSNKGIVTTEAGRILISHIRQQKILLERAISEIGQMKDGEKGHIRLSTAEVAPRMFLADEVASFQACYPNVTYDVNITGSDKVAASVVSEEVDFGIAVNPPKSKKLRALCSIPLFTHIIVRDNHPLCGNASVDLEECASYPLALYESRFDSRPMLEQTLMRRMLHLAPTTRSNSIFILRHMVKETDMICLGVLFPSDQKFRHNGLCVIPVRSREDELAATNLELIVNSDRALSVASQHLVDRICGLLSGIGSRGRGFENALSI
ncbi:LysR family transcriptional regulator [Aminobacter ciceronei]|uniref:DNA-binding transcriptional LysR family regulator n=1 Tax=Aminobacter ciceronei TaxID=150723 RepID=A0ABR6CI16_9HYPH|nr:LysR family transcriptional regulator [Aminobacter ciceronei]MBA8910913.1 DNA-binding transcriptional LysR family regulator [Aminobacter ciceronei]MBA9024691.1 DNA-binding transcriptional LysR family regulator [Aminobacter ciceronei]